MLLEKCIMGYYSILLWATSKIKKCHARNVTQNSVTHVEWNIVAENYKMASSLVDVASFPPEIISKIAQFLPLQDVLKCMLVCKSWKVSNSNNYGLCEFRSYFNTWYTYVGGYQDLQIFMKYPYYRPLDSSTVLCNPSAWNFQFILKTSSSHWFFLPRNNSLDWFKSLLQMVSVSELSEIGCFKFYNFL